MFAKEVHSDAHLVALSKTTVERVLQASGALSSPQSLCLALAVTIAPCLQSSHYPAQSVLSVLVRNSQVLLIAPPVMEEDSARNTA